MSIKAMKETRRKGESKRLESLHSLVKEARPIEHLSFGRRDELIEEAVANATGLNQHSQQTFRSECKLVLDRRVAPCFEDILSLCDKIWNDNTIDEHSYLHIVLKICKLIKGKRAADVWDVGSIEKYYCDIGSLPF